MDWFARASLEVRRQAISVKFNFIFTAVVTATQERIVTGLFRPPVKAGNDRRVCRQGLRTRAVPADAGR